MILEESVKNAIIKLQESKKAYDWILQHRDEVNEGTDDYHKKFNVLQQTFSAVDILLRCILIEYHIPFWKKSGNNYSACYITATDEDVKIYAKDAVCAIAYHNSQNPEDQVLPDVDFSSLIGDNKNVRNLDEHLGKAGTMHDMNRVFINLNKILSILEANVDKIQLQLNEWPDSFDFSRFDSCVHSFQTGARRYILITDSLHNIPKEQLLTFLSLPWSVLLDFDTTSAYGGIKSILNQYATTIRYNEYGYDSFDVNNTINFANNRMAYISISDDNDLRSRIIPKKENIAKDAINAKQISMKIRDTLHPYASIIVLGFMSKRMYDICRIIKDEFQSIDIVYLTFQNMNNEFLLQTTDQEEMEENGNVVDAYFFENSIFNVMKSIYDNRNLLPNRTVVQYDGDIGYRFPISDKNFILVQDEVQIERLEKNFEFIHLNLGENEHAVNKNEFFHGNIASWETIKHENIPFLIETESFRKSILNSEYRSYYLYHLPGFGGTTLGRLLCWELHKRMPTVWLRHMDSEVSLIRSLRDISKLFKNHPFIVFIDENEISRVDMQLIANMINDSNFRIIGIFIYRISVDEASQKQRKAAKNELILSLMEAKYKEKLLSECLDILKTQGQEEYYESRKNNMDATLQERDKCALLINLYLLEKNFKLDTYVSGFLHKIPKDSDGEKVKKVLMFTAIGAYFSNFKMPLSYFLQYMGISQRNFLSNRGMQKSTIEKILQPYDGLLLFVNNYGVEKYGVKHFLIAKEMLRQLLSSTDANDWRGKLDVVACDFIDMLQGLLYGMSQIDDSVEEIITSLFTDKTKSRYIDENIDDYSSSFTSFINAMNVLQQFKVIDYLCDKLEKFIVTKVPKGQKRKEYKLLAHIYAVRARIFSKKQANDFSMEFKEKELYEERLQKFILDTIQLIESEGLYEYDLEHMIGMCYLESAERMVESYKQLDEYRLNELFSTIDRAINRFDHTIWYGSPDYGIPCKLRAINCGLRGIINCYEISKEALVGKLNNISKAKEYRLLGINVIHSISEYDLTVKGRVLAEQQRNRFDEVYSMKTPSHIIERLENLRNKLQLDDYEGQYIISIQMIYEYERKYRTENMTGSGALLKKALKNDIIAQKDAKKVFSHLDRIVSMNNMHIVSYSTYNLWFEYAKYLEIPLSKAKTIALQWKSSKMDEVKSIRLSEHIRIRPYYYLFVIDLLLYMEQQSATAQEVVARRTDLDNVRDRTYKGGAVQDWYANRKGMGHLYSREWIDIGDVDEEPCIAEVRGKVMCRDENGAGYLHITQPSRLSSWTKPPKGRTYNNDCDVYFRLQESNIISEEDVGSGVEKRFKFGFSYNRALASQKSIENRNIKESILMNN